ncbi:MAG: TolC family protein [Candidatus Cloacimonadota bacterium]|nr:TolC family protein [Candidatus Cloacimonadota bacterium]
MKKNVVLIVFLLLASNLIANQISLENAKILALKNNPDLLAQKEELKSAKMDNLNAISGLLPSANISNSYTKYKPDQNFGAGPTAESSKSYRIQISQPLFNGGKIWLNSRIKNDALQISEQSYQMKKLETLAEVESKYFSVLENKSLLKIAKKALQSAITNLDVAEMKYNSGIISRADYLQLQSEKTSKEVNLIQAQNLYQTSKLQIANFLQLAVIPELQPIEFYKYSKILKHLQNISIEETDNITGEIIEIGFSKNPSLKISSISCKTGKKALLMAEGNFLPSLNLSYSKSWNKYDFMNDYDDSQNLTLSASLPLFPLVDSGTGVLKAKHNLKKTELQKISAENGIKLSLSSSFLNLVSSAKSVSAAKKAKEQAEETYKQMQERYSSGLISTNDLLSAQVLFISSQSQYTKSFYDFLRTKSSLMQQMGIEDTNVLYRIIQK